MAREILTHGWSFRRRATAFQELAGSDTAVWTGVMIPHDACLGLPRVPDLPNGETSAYFPGGSFEYRRTLHAGPELAGRVVTLEFDGVYRDAMVYVNGTLAGQHAYGYSRFTVRIDPYLRVGQDNEIKVACRAYEDSRWYTGAGIYREVALATAEQVRLPRDGVRVTTPDVSVESAVVEVAATVVNDSSGTATRRVGVSVRTSEGAEVAAGTAPITLLPGESGVLRHRLVVEQPSLWDELTPVLYRAQVELSDGDRVTDGEVVSFGIRSLQVDPHRGLRVNGRVVNLRGACIHADNGPLGAVSLPRAEERRIALLKAAGFNAIRSAHHPASVALLDACDRLGMFVMDETFDMWTSGKTNWDYAFDFPQWWEKDVEAMVAGAFNHPSVIMYSIGNEIPELGDRFGGAWSRRIAEKVRSLDGTRFITNGVNGFVAMLDMVLPMIAAARAQAAQAALVVQADPNAVGGGVNAMMDQQAELMGRVQAAPQTSAATEEAFAVLDVAGLNYGTTRYELDAELYPNRVVVGAETWAGSIAKNWELVQRYHHLIGDFAWSGWDYLGETGIGRVHYADPTGGAPTGFSGGYPELTSSTGDLDITGHRRPASYYREIVFGLRHEPYIAVLRPQFHGVPVAVATQWAWSDAISSWTWEGFEGQPVSVEVYAAADEVELLVNGTSVGRSAVGQTRAFRAEFELTYQPGELLAVAYINGVESTRTSLTTANATLVLNANLERSVLASDGRDLSYLTLTLTDDHAVLHPGHDRRIDLSVDGPGVVVGVASGNPTTEESLVGSSITTYDGRAVAVIRATGAGVVTVMAQADGVDPVRLELRVQ